MIPTILSSLIFMRRRTVMELVSPRWRKLWKEWELRLMILLSLIFQIALIFFGNCRKYNPRIWIKVILWSAYLMADSIATIALGVLSNDLGEIYGDHGHLEPNNELTAFWAPFLLLHLGGPDTITAYALEDNELWLRHAFGLLAQTVVAIYIFLMAWTGSRLSILAMMMILVGFFKYAERTWVLWSASSEQLRDSMLTSPEPGPDYAKFMDEFSLKQAEGFYVRTEDVIEAQESVDYLDTQESSIPDENELRRASELLKRFKRLFVDLILSFHDRNFSQSLFKDMSHKEAFKVIEIELAFMYDLLYTKAKVAYTPAGFLRHLLCLLVTCLVLLFFSLTVKQKKYDKVDISITFLLLAVAIVLELYASLLLLISDQTDLWLSKRKKNSTFQAISFLQLRKRPRWSHSMAQYSLISVCLKEKPATFLWIQKLLHINERLEKVRYTTCEEVSEPLRESIFKHIKEKYEKLQRSSNDEDVRAFCTCRGGRVLEKYNCRQLDWSTKKDYDQSILIWHIATELCYYSDRADVLGGNEYAQSIKSKFKMSKYVSQYVVSLLVRYPLLLPVGIGLIRFRDTCAEGIRFFEARRSTLNSSQALQNGSQDRYKIQACEMLLKVNTRVPPKKVKGDRSKSVLFDACRLALELNNITDKKNKWEMVSEIWVELLAYAANQCRGSPHAQQLRRGGELLTHVWLLMAHFGITEQFQISEGHARAKLIVK